MLQMLTWKRVAASAVFVSVAAAAVVAQQQGPARGNHDWASPVPQGKHHNLAATLETVQWGWLDPREKPKLVVDSGDTVSVETMMHSHDKVQPGMTIEQAVELRKANPGGGPHSMTGPIYVNGAEPGDVLEIRILRIEPKAWAVNFNLPGKDFPTIGALASEMPEGHIKFFPLDLEKRTAEFKPGIVLDLQPFPGTFAVGIDPNDPAPRKGGVKDDPLAPVSTLRPWKNGSNMDINELQEGSTIFIPVFLKGGLIWTGDSHCRQGNGEVNLTALECSYKEIRIQPIVRKDITVNWPFIETRTHWITTGFHEDLNVAMTNAVREAVDWLANQKIVPMNRYEAYGLVSMVGDCRVSQVVDIRKGVHCMIPKSIFTNLKKIVIRAIILVLTALAAAAPGRAFAQERLPVITTSADLRSLVEAVGGDKVEVESLAAPEQDPHTVEVKPGQLARLRRAALIVKIGLDHEPWLARLPRSQAPVVDASKSVRLLQIETPRLRVERKAHVHAYGNTHYWLDPRNAEPITASILAALVQLRPADKALFEANRVKFLVGLNEKISEWETALKPYRGTKVVVVHDSWSYFAERFGFQIVAAAEPHPGVPPSPTELAALFRRMREGGVRILIADPHANPALVRQIVEKGGAKPVTLFPSGSDYIGLFEENVKRLSATLRTG